jgi:hypothetical protein
MTKIESLDSCISGVPKVVESLSYVSLKSCLDLLDWASNEGLPVFVAGNGGSQVGN